MAGGIGSRFWPMSRTAHPKQFLDILGTGQSLLQSTYQRFSQLVPEENIYIVTNIDYIDLVQQQLPTAKLHQIIGEPARRNTAPCVAYMAHKLRNLNPNATFIVAPSDHHIIDEQNFQEILQKALSFATNNDVLLTLGIQPNIPHTGYGYIQFDEEIQQEPWRPKVLYRYVQDNYIIPDLVVDITSCYAVHREAILAYRSQFYNESSTEPHTPISTKEFMAYNEARCREYGRQIGVTFAEGFSKCRYLGVKDLFHLL